MTPEHVTELRKAVNDWTLDSSDMRSAIGECLDEIERFEGFTLSWMKLSARAHNEIKALCAQVAALLAQVDRLQRGDEIESDRITIREADMQNEVEALRAQVADWKAKFSDMHIGCGLAEKEVEELRVQVKDKIEIADKYEARWIDARAEVEALRAQCIDLNATIVMWRRIADQALAQVAELTKDLHRAIDIVEKGEAGHSPYESCACSWCRWYAALGEVAK